MTNTRDKGIHGNVCEILQDISCITVGLSQGYRNTVKKCLTGSSLYYKFILWGLWSSIYSFGCLYLNDRMSLLNGRLRRRMDQGTMVCRWPVII